ncbi:unnamed protein product [Moneuplotes crassus]|uniref:AP2/ERF domain-containing protein n=1 Tax=Euplotes crassus TaxID=5936 RepID=A0AAD1XZS8_EUPCR|nr:unnamed protein product [Moneuplotes crassus]
MNFSNFDNASSCIALPIWSSSDIIRELNAVYCTDQIEQEVQRIQSLCTCRCLKSPEKLISQYNINEIETKTSDIKIFQHNYQASNDEEVVLKLKSSIKPNKLLTKKRSRFSAKNDITRQLLSLKWSILNGYVTRFTSSHKKSKSIHKKNLRRRSEYIGVSRNNTNWQVLVNVNKANKYIGTFGEELQAARAYDLYSVAMRGEAGSLNFTYSAEDMLERIEYYLEHKCVKFD